MTKDTYFEMCEALGSEPVESEIPVEFDDFPFEVQQAFNAYRMLRDEWDFMNGNYLGKSLIGVKDVLEATEVDASEPAPPPPKGPPVKFVPTVPKDPPAPGFEPVPPVPEGPSP